MQSKYKIEGEELYFASKYTTDKDIIIKFSKTYHNELMSFSRVYLRDNAGDPDTNITNATQILGMGDNISPYIYDGVFVGGNHSMEGTLVSLASNYTAGESNLVLTDSSDFVAVGGIGQTDGYKNFYYTGITGNTLTGVTGLDVNLTTDNQVRNVHQTAETTSFEFQYNGVGISEAEGNLDYVDIVVHNTIWDINTLNRTTGAMDILLLEDIIYTVRDGSVSLRVEITPKKDFELDGYYGMMFAASGTTWQNKIYMSDAEDVSIRDKVDGLTAGDFDTYSSNRAIIHNTDGTINMSMYMFNTGLASDRQLLDSQSTLFTSNGKAYHALIRKATNMITDSMVFWEGIYTFFSNKATNFSYVYNAKSKNNEYWFMDAHQVISESVDRNIANIIYSTIQNNDITIDTNTQELLEMTSDASYANAILKY